MTGDRPLGVTFAAGWAAITGVIFVALTLAGLLGGAAGETAWRLALAGTRLLVGAGLLVAAVGLLRTRPWSQRTAVALFAVVVVMRLLAVLQGAVLAVGLLALDAVVIGRIIANGPAFVVRDDDDEGDLKVPSGKQPPPQ